MRIFCNPGTVNLGCSWMALPSFPKGCSVNDPPIIRWSSFERAVVLPSQPVTKDETMVQAHGYPPARTTSTTGSTVHRRPGLLVVRCPINMGNEYQALEGLRLKAMKGTTNTNRNFVIVYGGAVATAKCQPFAKVCPKMMSNATHPQETWPTLSCPYDIFNTKGSRSEVTN